LSAHFFLQSQQSQQSFSFYEAPTEEEQYQWAMEESIRASQQTMRQDSAVAYKLKDEEDEDKLVSSQVFGEDNPFANPDFASTITRSRSESEKASAHSSKINTPKVSPKLELPDRKGTFIVHEDKNKGVCQDDSIKSKDDGDEDSGDEDDKQMKAVLLASLTEKDIQEQEEREFEEAIRRSLLDQEDNKENISPDKAASQKKLEKKKMAATLTRSCSQLDTSTLDRRHRRHQTHHLRKRVPAQLKRSITIDFIDKQGHMRGKEGLDLDSPSFSQSSSSSQSPSPTETLSQPIRLELPHRTRQSDSNAAYCRAGQGKDDQNGTKSTPLVVCLDDEEDHTTPSRRVTRGSKGKDRASSSQKQAEEDHSLGLFRLEAVVSHTGLSMSPTTSTSAVGGGGQQRGRYVCDRLGTDGIWRSFEGSKTSRLGSISDLTRYRARSGYLFFYVRCHPGAIIS
jgi:hypothetical protein